MEKKEYKYDAFISYRHSELDKFVAEKLHKELETYKIPKNIKDNLNIKEDSIKRVFRDQEELPLSSNLEDPIVEALKESKYLIVICSPRLKDSLWCKKEIETFKKLRGRKNIFCVLIEGEPKDSFPKELLYDEKEKINVEPLAADVRGSSKKEVLKKIKEEKLRLIAPMFDLNYDDLKQRHKQREHKRKMMIIGSIALFFILFSLYSSIMLIKINSQKNKLRLNQAYNLASSANDYLKTDSRYNAIKASYEALTKYDSVKMPYTSEAEYSLVESLGVYDTGFSYKAKTELETKGVVDYIKSNYDGKYSAIYDESGELTLFDSSNLNIIKKYEVNDAYTTLQSFSFSGNNLLLFSNKDGNISVVNTKDGKEITEIKRGDKAFIGAKGDSKESIISYTDGDKLYIYSIKDKKVISSFSNDQKVLKEIYYVNDDKYIVTFTTSRTVSVNDDQEITMHILDSSNGKEKNSFTFNAGYINGITEKDDNLYLIYSNNSITDTISSVLSYNYNEGKENFTKSYRDKWFSYITRSYPEGSNNIAVASYDLLIVLDASSGNEVSAYNFKSKIIGLYSYLNNEIYLVFQESGNVGFVNMERKNSVEYVGKYELNVDKYTAVTPSEDGFLFIPYNENRIISYERLINKDAKKIDIEIETPNNEIAPSKYDKLKKSYKVKNKNLVNNMFYNDKKDLLFVSYTNQDLVIYNVKDKAILGTFTDIDRPEYYFGKDIYGRIYLGNLTNSYIIDKNYNKVGHIKRLRKVDKDKVIISNDNSEYYQVKIYTLDELIKLAKDYLKR